jgi:hypothetical protein
LPSASGAAAVTPAVPACTFSMPPASAAESPPACIRLPSGAAGFSHIDALQPPLAATAGSVRLCVASNRAPPLANEAEMRVPVNVVAFSPFGPLSAGLPAGSLKWNTVLAAS